MPLRTIPRRFSTATRVHPSFLPHLHPQLRHAHLRASQASTPARWLRILVIVSLLGVGTRTYLQSAYHRSTAERQQQDDELQRRNMALMDQYGDRSSLEELEKAVQFYQKK